MKTKNINSKYPPDNELLHYLIGQTGFLSDLAEKTPVYFVDEELMDIIYPPYKGELLVDSCLKNYLTSLKNKLNKIESDIRYPEKLFKIILDESDEFWNRAKECKKPRKIDKYLIALGVYSKNINDNNKNKIIDNINGNFTISTPCIFICPERIKRWSKKLSNRNDMNANINRIYKNIFAKVFIHELAHAYMNTDKKRYITSWGKIIEESLANAIAYQTISHNFEKGIVNIAISEQPIEYRGYIYFKEMRKGQAREIVRAWRDNKRLVPQLLTYGLFIEKGMARRFYKEIYNITHYYQNSDDFWKYIATKILIDLL